MHGHMYLHSWIGLSGELLLMKFSLKESYIFMDNITTSSAEGVFNITSLLIIFWAAVETSGAEGVFSHNDIR